LMRRYETYCGVRVLSFCVMTNHFHILLEVPKRPAPENLPTDNELVERLRLAKCSYGAETLAQQLARLRQTSRNTEAEALRERFFAHMWDVGFFMRLLKQRFSQWFNTVHDRKGTLWEERFRSVLVEGGDALRTVSFYVDLNPVRAGIVKDPKDYRWSSYGEAVAGVRRAVEGLCAIIEGLSNSSQSEQQRLAMYRVHLFARGEVWPEQTDAFPGKLGFSQDEVVAVDKAKGELRICDKLSCRIRRFTEGFLLGSELFVEHHFGMRQRNSVRFRSNLGIRRARICRVAGFFCLAG
ncbi:MAG: transposase, partial [Verrucomicrobiota bacterium]